MEQTNTLNKMAEHSLRELIIEAQEDQEEAYLRLSEISNTEMSTEYDEMLGEYWKCHTRLVHLINVAECVGLEGVMEGLKLPVAI